MANTKDYVWFVEPLGDASHVNEVIYRALDTAVGSDENMLTQKICADGKPHNLWNCSRENAKRLWDSRGSSGITIKIWVKKGRGKIRDADFLFKSQPCPKARQLLKQVKQQKATSP